MYRKRVITYNDNTQIYTISIPELSIECYSDTESGCLPEARKAEEDYVKNRSKLIENVSDKVYDEHMD